MALSSPPIPRSALPGCFSFWHYMFGSPDTVLNVFISMASKPATALEYGWLLKESGRTTADRWYHVHRTIKPQGSATQVSCMRA